MDGNGRLSRFLFHHALCRAGVLEHGLLLPVSAAMKEDESGYLAALESFSAGARETSAVTHIDADRFASTFLGTSQTYRHWDATAQKEIGFRSAWSALTDHPMQEVEFLDRSDRVKAPIEEAFDVRDAVLQHLVKSALQHAGTLSKSSRKKYADVVQNEVFDEIERQARIVLADKAGPGVT